jgi:hypothetical protein
MDRTNELLPDSPVEFLHSSSEFDPGRSDDKACIPAWDRIARLLRILRELDGSNAGLEQLAVAELSDLIYDALRESGFVDPIEARHAIAAVLETIETQAPGMQSS